MVPYLRVANVFENRIDLSDVKEMNFTPAEQQVYLLKPDDILLNEGQSPHLVGRPALYRGELSPCFFQNTLVRFRANPDVLPGWALLVFRTQLHARRYMRFATITTNIAHLGAERFGQVEFPIPPLGVQQSIIQAFDTFESRLDAAVASLTRARANVKRARASVLKAAVEGRLVPTEASLARAEGRDYEPTSVLLARILAERRAKWAAKGGKGKYKEPVQHADEGMGELPEGWCWASLDQLLERLQTGPFGSTLHRSDYVQGGTPVVNPQHLQNFKIEPSDTVTIGVETVKRLFGFQMNAGDIVLGRRGEMGRCAVVGMREDGWILGTGSLSLRLLESVHRGFIAWALRSPGTVRFLEGESVGTTMTNLNQEILLGLPVALPPLAEQHRIVNEVERRLSVLDTLDTTINANLARCARLRQSILKRAFEGRLVSSGERVSLTHPASNPPLLARCLGDTRG